METTIEIGLYRIERYLIRKYGVDVAQHDIDPLKWYIYTGRSSVEFMRKLFAAKPFMVARKLHIGGSYDDVLNRIKDYCSGI